jgi:RHS repeat-associated protein
LSRITNILAPEGTYRFGYLAQGARKTSLTYPNGVTAALFYDNLIRMTNLAYSVGASNLLTIQYGYDAGDRRASEVWGDGRSMTYAYDRAHQLLDAISDSRASDAASYRYDQAGNPLRRIELGLGITNSFNALNQIVAGIWTGGAITVAGAVNYNAGTVTVNSVTADRFGLFYERTNVSLTVGTNLITAVYNGPGFTNHPNVVTAQTQVVVGQTAYTHDPNGNLIADANFLYHYDALNQLTNVVTKQGGTNLLANRYDGLGRRVQATTGTNIVRYVYLPGTFLVLATLDAANNLLETFTHGPDLSGTLGGAGGIGGILSQTKHQGPTTTHFLHSDAMGNVVMTTDGSGNISSTYRYTPFGRLYAKTGPFTIRFTFSSKEFEPATGLGYWGYRFYSPGLRRWLNRDPIGEQGGVNLYGYVDNSPILWTDNYGLFINTLLGPSRDGSIRRPGYISGRNPYQLSRSQCEYFENVIMSRMNTKEEKLAWQHYITASGDIEISKNEWSKILFGNRIFNERIATLKSDCTSSVSWASKAETFFGGDSPNPWRLAIGRYDIILTHSCEKGCLKWKAELNDLYNFDRRDWLFNKQGREAGAELKTRAVELLTDVSCSHWESFYHKGVLESE